MKSLTRLFTLLVVCACSTAAIANDVVPGAPQKEPIALVGGTVHPVVGPVVENGTILFEAGKLTAVGRDVALPKNVRKIDVRENASTAVVIRALFELAVGDKVELRSGAL